MDNLDKLDGQNLSMPMNLDAEGYFDRQCHSVNCGLEFKVLMSDWKNLFKDEQVFCPFCRHDAPANEWQTDEQASQIKKQVVGYVGGIVKNHVTNVLRAALEGIGNERVRPVPHPDKKSNVTISWNLLGATANHIFVPITAKEAFTLKVTCEECSAHYAVIGSGFFCPNCGHNSAERTFDDALRKAVAKLDYQRVVRNSVVNKDQVDNAELVIRDLAETALSACVGAFQRLCEQLFKRHFPNVTVPFNIFQRLDAASDLWRNQLGFGYDYWLSEAQFQEMKILYQRRHLLAHNEGIVDNMYVQKSADTAYKEGQRIVVKEKDVRSLIEHVSTIASGLKGALTKT